MHNIQTLLLELAIISEIKPHHLNCCRKWSRLFLFMYEKIAASETDVNPKRVVKMNDAIDSKVSLPKIIIYDVDNNIVKTDVDLGVSPKNKLNCGQQLSRFGNNYIKRDKLPSGSNAFQQLLQEIYDEDDNDTNLVDSNSKSLRRARTDKVITKLITAVGRTNSAITNPETERTDRYPDGGVYLKSHNKEGRKSAPDSMRPQIFSLTGTRGLDAFWSEINGTDAIFVENEGVSTGRGMNTLSRAKTNVDLSKSSTGSNTRLERMNISVSGNGKTDTGADKTLLKPQTKRIKQRRKSAPESQRPHFPGLSLARERSVHGGEPRVSRNSKTILPKINTRSRHRCDGTLSMNSILKKTVN